MMESPNTPRPAGLDILHLSIHGLIRGENLELGRDPDTGGQCLYVLELVKALASDPGVRKVSLITRRVIDPRLSDTYAAHRETLADNAEIIRIDAGPRRYLRKEVLWRHLDAFIDGTLAFLRREKRMPDLIHAHYADAGYVGRQIAAVLGCPFVFTGHSLGRVKRQRLVESGGDADEMELRYNLAARIEAEELSLDAASLVCASTRQEVDDQYAIYDQHSESRMRVIPPGVDLSRFDSPTDAGMVAEIDAKFAPFLRDPSRPPVLTIARADERKNLPGLVRAFARNPWLRENTNLIIIAGKRDALEKLPPGTRRVWNDLLTVIDDSDLYGITAYPKTHNAAEVAAIYQWCALRKGVFINPAFTEPFGLTLLEAAAAGLPLVATSDGGPRDILGNCRNGILVDPLDEKSMGDAITEILSLPAKREELANIGSQKVREHYSWRAHVKTYLRELSEILPPTPVIRTSSTRGSLVERERWIVMDLLPNIENQPGELISHWRDLFLRQPIGFGIATGLSFDEAWEVIERCDMPRPGFVIPGLGSEIRYGETGVHDERWHHQIGTGWERDAILATLAGIPGLTLQGERFQHRYKISYLMDAKRSLGRLALQRLLREAGLAAKVIVTARSYVDVIPIRSGKDVALRYLQHRWGIDPSRIFYFGTYGNDIAVVRGRNLSALASDSDRVLRQLHPRPRLYHATKPGLEGFFEGLDHYRFLDDIETPMPSENAKPGEETVPSIELHP